MPDILESVMDEEAPPLKYRKWLARFALFVCLSTLFLIYMGGLVKSFEAGLSVHDWPTSMGENMFTYSPAEWWHLRGYGADGVFWEHSHRLVASVVGFLMLVLAFWLPFAESRWWLILTGLGALCLVITQGVLGGLTVLLHLPPAVSISHGVAAQAFLMLTVIIAYSLSWERIARHGKAEAEKRCPALTKWAVAMVGAVFLQLILGAVMRHNQAGLAIPDFPMTAGHIVPRFDEASVAWVNEWARQASVDTGLAIPRITRHQMIVHFTHRVGAVVVTVIAIGLTLAARRHAEAGRGILRSIYLLDMFVAAQFVLGVVTVLSIKHPILTSLHVVTGAALLAWSVVTLLRIVPVQPAQIAEESLQ